MGATIVRPLQRPFWPYLIEIQRSFCVVSWQPRRHWFICVHTKDQGKIQTMGFTRCTCFKEGEHRAFVRKGESFFFGDARGVIHTDCLEKVKTITGPYCIDLLSRFTADLKNKTTSFGSPILHLVTQNLKRSLAGKCTRGTRKSVFCRKTKVVLYGEMKRIVAPRGKVYRVERVYWK